MRSSSGCGTGDCGQTSATSRPLTMLSPPSTRPSDARGRRSSAFVRERHAPIDPCSRTIAIRVGWLRPISPSHREACMAFTLKINGTPHEVDVDGDTIRSCQTPVDNVGDSAITTIEAIGQTPQGAALQKAWLELEVVQCGYCQSGQIMSAAALLKDTPKPTDDDIDAAMSGNVCRCGTYQRIRAAIKHAAGV